MGEEWGMGGSHTWGGYTCIFRIRGETLFVRYCLKSLTGSGQYRRSVLGGTLLGCAPCVLCGGVRIARCQVLFIYSETDEESACEMKKLLRMG